MNLHYTTILLLLFITIAGLPESYGHNYDPKPESGLAKVKFGSGPKEVWERDGPHKAGKSYANSFRPLIESLGFKWSTLYFDDLLQQRRDQSKSTHVLDLMGSAFLIENQELADSLTGLRWGPYDRSVLPANYPESKVPHEVLGDIKSTETWERLDASMAERNIKAFDLIDLRVRGGWFALDLANEDEQIAVHAFIFQNVLKRLALDGRYLFEVPVSRYRPPTREFVNQFQRLQLHISTRTSFRLILAFRPPLPGRETHYMSGALLPLNDLCSSLMSSHY